MLPVSPQPLHSHSLSPLGAGSAEEDGVHSEEEEEVDMQKALLADPIVGAKSVVMDQHGPGAIPAKPLASPPSMTQGAGHSQFNTLAISPWLCYLCRDQKGQLHASALS